MSVKVIFICSKTLWFDIAVKLIKDTGWEPCIWISTGDLEQRIRQTFPECIYINNFDSMKGIIPPEFSDLELQAIDEELLKELSFNESIVLKMMDRMDMGGSFSYVERVRLFHSKLRFWQTVLDHLKPDLYIRPLSPHVVDDYILYILCRKKGIKTILFERTAIPDIVFPLENFEEGSEKIKSEYRRMLESHGKEDIVLSDISEKHLKKTSRPYSEAMPFYLRSKLEKIGKKDVFKKNNKVHDAVNSIARIPARINNLMDLMFNKQEKTYIKEKGSTIEESDISALQQQLYNFFIARRKQKKIRSHYNELSQDVDLNQPYIYVALHCQPERTTSPNGGMFAHQYLLVDLLSKSLPQGWSLYIKEHISQFQPYKFVERGKDRVFYNDIASLPNVKIVPLSLSPFELMDHSRATATVAGNSGWESIVRGRPVLVFGHAWYRGCEGVFYTPTRESCSAAISKIEAGYKVDTGKVRLFVKVMEEVCTRGYLSEDWGEISELSYEQNLSSITKAIKDTYYQ